MVELDAKRFGSDAVRYEQPMSLGALTRRYGFHFTIADRCRRVHGGGLLADAGGVLFHADGLPAEFADARDVARAEAAAAAAAGDLGRDRGARTDQVLFGVFNVLLRVEIGQTLPAPAAGMTSLSRALPAGTAAGVDRGTGDSRPDESRPGRNPAHAGSWRARSPTVRSACSTPLPPARPPGSSSAWSR